MNKIDMQQFEHHFEASYNNVYGIGDTSESAIRDLLEKTSPWFPVSKIPEVWTEIIVDIYGGYVLRLIIDDDLHSLWEAYAAELRVRRWQYYIQPDE